MRYEDDHPCPYCDRTTDEISACPSAHATACSSRSFNAMLAAIQRVNARLDASGNYIADKESAPTKVTFANGRTVSVVRGKLVVGWDRKGAEQVFEQSSKDSAK